MSKPKLERYGGSKVRTGCVTCKARRVKCDEGKPTCARCAKAGRLCGGYKPPPPPKERNLAGQPLTIINYIAPASMISSLPGASAREQRSLEFFRTRTILETFSHAGWSDHVLRTSHYEDAIKHAVVALGALHEHYQNKSEMDSGFAMLQYSKAMKKVMELDMRTNASADVALISCLLFACFESLQGHYRSSLLHVKSGLQILEEQGSSDVADLKVAYVSKEVLRPLFLRFVTQSREIGDSAIYLAYSTLPPNAQIPVSAFRDFSEAYNSMHTYVHEFTMFLASISPQLPPDPSRNQTIIEHHGALVTRFAAWSKAFDELLKRGTEAAKADIAKVQIWRIVIEMALSLDISLKETGWDSKIELFRKLLNHAEIVVASQPKERQSSGDMETMSEPDSVLQLPRPASNGQDEESTISKDLSMPLSAVDVHQSLSPWQPVFSLDLGIIAPLCITTFRCRDPAIRRRGLQLLASCNRREGIWDSTLAARVAERVIAIEESGAVSQPVLYAQQIPEHARIRVLSTNFGAQREGYITYKKSVAFPGPADTYQEFLQW